MEATITQLASGKVETEFTVGQYNLLTGELEPFASEPAPLPEETWLFDPDFGLVLTDTVREQGIGYRERERLKTIPSATDWGRRKTCAPLS